MDGTVRSGVSSGTRVSVVQKADQRTGGRIEGVVRGILTPMESRYVLNQAKWEGCRKSWAEKARYTGRRQLKLSIGPQWRILSISDH